MCAILVSLEQMRNLYVEFKHSPQVDYLTCAAFGMKDFPVPISTTNHLIIDLANLKHSPEIVECTWLTEKVEWAKSATEINISPQDFAESLMQQEHNGTSAEKVSGKTKTHVSSSKQVTSGV